MIDHEALARELYARIKRTNHYPSDPLDEQAADLELITEAMQAVERETWEQAARIAAEMPTFGGEQKRLMATMIQMCRHCAAIIEG